MKRFFSALASGLFLGMPVAASYDILADDNRVPFAIVDQQLVSVLEEFGSSAGIPMTIDRSVGGRVSNFNQTLSPRRFLDQIAADHGLVWYFDGSSIHVTPASANGSVVIDFRKVTAGQLNEALEQLGVSDPRFAVRQTSDDGLGVVSGPPRYVEMVENTFLLLAKRVQQPVVARARPRQITVIRGEQIEVWTGAERISSVDTAPLGPDAHSVSARPAQAQDEEAKQNAAGS